MSAAGGGAGGSPAPQAFAFIRRAGGAGDAALAEAFGEVELVAGDSVARLAARACALFGWGPPTRARLHLVARARAAALDGGAAVEPADFGARLSALDSLAAAGVVPGACLLARISADAPAGGGSVPAADLAAAVERSVARALDDAALVDSLNPFARAHHSDMTEPARKRRRGDTCDGPR